MSCPECLPAMIGTMSAAIATGRSDEELTLLAAFFTQLGDSLAVILASRACAQSNKSASPNDTAALL